MREKGKDKTTSKREGTDSNREKKEMRKGEMKVRIMLEH